MIIKGENIILIQKIKVGTDKFDVPIYDESEYKIENVLVCEPTTDDYTDTVIPDGKSLAYVLCIPKGDANTWEDTDVIIRGKKFRTVGMPMEYTEENVPLAWNKKVKVIRYE